MGDRIWQCTARDAAHYCGPCTHVYPWVERGTFGPTTVPRMLINVHIDICLQRGNGNQGQKYPKSIEKSEIILSLIRVKPLSGIQQNRRISSKKASVQAVFTRSLNVIFVQIYSSFLSIAYCDLVSHLTCYNWAQKEAKRYGEKWNKKWARDNAYTKILGEIPRILEKHAIVVDKKQFNSWNDYLNEFLSKGIFFL